jgi:acyl-coenzyme A synthetase/AMP-(fatty) acid ligase
MTADPRIPLARLACADAAADARPVTTGIDRGAWRARIAAWQRHFAAVPADDVALHLDDAGEFSAALFAAWLAGKTPWLPGDVLAPTLVRLAAHVGSFAGDFPEGWHADVAADEAGGAGGALDPERCAVVLFTSGSTGEPVAIRKSLRQLDAEVGALEAQFGSDLGDAVVHGTVSHQHIYGLLFRVLWPLSAGRRFAPTRRAYTEELTALGAEPLVLVASPAHLKRLPPGQDWRRFAGGLRAVFSSGGPLPADAAQDVRALWGQPAIEVFGSTETGGIAWRRGAGAVAAWTPLPGVQWRLHDDCLQVRAPHLADDGWLATQDRARAGLDGGFELLGRADRIVKIEERRISLDAIERRLRASDWLHEARVVALPGARVLLAVAAVANAEGERRLAEAGRAGLAADLRDWLAGHVDPIALPRRWRFVAALPADAQGKCSERALLALFRPLMPAPDWQQRGAAQASATLAVAADLAPFDGHFPQAPILPGVVLVDWAVRLARDAFALDGGLMRMDALKFQHVVHPGTQLHVQLDWQPATAADAVLGFRFTSTHGVHASGRLHFAAPVPP